MNPRLNHITPIHSVPLLPPLITPIQRHLILSCHRPSPELRDRFNPSFLVNCNSTRGLDRDGTALGFRGGVEPFLDEFVEFLEADGAIAGVVGVGVEGYEVFEAGAAGPEDGGEEILAGESAFSECGNSCCEASDDEGGDGFDVHDCVLVGFGVSGRKSVGMSVSGW